MKINYHNKTFRPISVSKNGEVSNEVLFLYQQTQNIISANYSGGSIVQGHLLGLVDENGVINMRYHQVNHQGEIMTGQCISTPEIMYNGKIRLYEQWQWTSGDFSKGTSILEEI